MITGRKPTDFTPLNSLVGDEKFYTQSLTDSFQSTLPAIGDYMETYINGDKTQQQGTYLVSGGRVVWVEDLKFTVTAAVYLINGIRYTSEEQEVTLTTADPTNPRIDTFYLDVNSQFGAIAGTPAATPAEPSINPETQIRLTIATINAGATTPAGISNEIIYNENLGVAGGEWDTSVNILGYSTFEDTADPAKDSKSIKTSVFEINTLTLRFTNNANINLSDYDSLVLRVRQRGRAASNQGITLYWSDTIGASYSWNPSVLLRPGTFGFTTPNEEWQTIVIPIASFNPYEANRVASRLSIGISSRSGTLMWEFDDIYLQSGVKQNIIDPVEVKVGKTLFVDSVYGDDTTAERENFIKPFRTAAAAEAQALSGDTIVFRPGLHTARNLGKDGVIYHIQPGGELKNVTTGTYLFTDNGKGTINIKVVCHGMLHCSGNTMAFRQYNGGTWDVYVADFLKDGGIPSAAIFYIYNGNFNIVYEKCFINYGTTTPAFLAEQAGGIITMKGNYARSIPPFIYGSNGGEIYADLNYLWFYELGAGDNVIKANNAGSLVHVKVNLLEVTDGNAYSVLFCETRNSGWVQSKLIFEGNIKNYTGIRTVVVEDWGIVELRNAKIEKINDTSGNRLVTFVNNTATSKLIMNNVELINYGTSANDEGILAAAFNSPAGVATIEMNNVLIKLHTTAVAAGAKAIDDGAVSVNYAAYTDVLSNGAFDGTNLIASTATIVDPNVKSG